MPECAVQKYLDSLVLGQLQLLDWKCHNLTFPFSALPRPWKLLHPLLFAP